METGPEAKARLMRDAATRGEFGLKLCERHYFAHIEDSPECVVQTASQLCEFFNVLPEMIDDELEVLNGLVAQLEGKVGSNEVANEGDTDEKTE